MNPIFTWTIAETALESLARPCPQCGRKQVVPEAQKRKTVTCSGCGASIPPKRKKRGQ